MWQKVIGFRYFFFRRPADQPTHPPCCLVAIFFWVVPPGFLVPLSHPLPWPVAGGRGPSLAASAKRRSAWAQLCHRAGGPCLITAGSRAGRRFLSAISQGRRSLSPTWVGGPFLPPGLPAGPNSCPLPVDPLLPRPLSLLVHCGVWRARKSTNSSFMNSATACGGELQGAQPRRARLRGMALCRCFPVERSPKLRGEVEARPSLATFRATTPISKKTK